jgi:NADPH-dependent 2,4-dienoyl-CoA reductase/sulfur reductase-like enzyme
MQREYDGFVPRRRRTTSLGHPLGDTRRTLEQVPPGLRVQVDVVVVGAGPTGSNTARLLAARGWKVLLLEEHA